MAPHPSSSLVEALAPDTAVVWDLDATLLDGNAGSLFIKSLLKTDLPSTIRRLRLYLAFLLFHIRLLPDLAALREAHRIFVGMREDQLKQLALPFVNNILRAKYFAEAVTRIKWHKARGHRLILLSGSPHFLVSEIGRDLAFDSAVGTMYEERGGIIYDVDTPIVYGSGKVAVLEKLGILGPVHTYTDDVMDLPLLRRATSASLVNPSSTLLVEATSIGLPSEQLCWRRTIGDADAVDSYRQST